MPKHLKLKVTKVGNYKPTSWEYRDIIKNGGIPPELTITLYCSQYQNGNKKDKLTIFGIDARMWCDVDPRNIPEVSKVRHLITAIEQAGKSYNEGKDLWCVHTKYPFEITKVRDAIKECGAWTGLADLTYEKAFRIHNGMRSPYISVASSLNKAWNISEITMRDNP